MSTEPRTIAAAAMSPTDLRFTRLSLSRVWESVSARDAPVQPAAGLDRARQTLAVHLDQAEAHLVAARPLEVVDVRPVKVPAHVHAVPDGETHVRQDVDQVLLPPLVIFRAQPVLRYVHGLAESFELVENRAHRARVGGPAHVADRRTWNVEAPDELVLRPAQIEGGVLRVVVRDADEVGRRFDHLAQPAWRDGPAVHHQLSRLCGPPIPPPGRRRQERELVV